LFVEIDDDIQSHLTRIMGSHPRLVVTVKGRSGADPFVIALAATTRPSMIVVTEEYEGKIRIPDVCTAEKIKWCSLADLWPLSAPKRTLASHARELEILMAD
jgi:hypothetical protein